MRACLLLLVSVLGRVVLGRDDKAPALARAPVDGLNDVDHLMFVVERPVDLVVVARAQVDHDVLVAEEEHDGARVIELVHRVEVRHLRDVHHVDHRKVLDVLGDAAEHLVHLHARRVVVVAEAHDHHAVALVQNRLIHGPAGLQVRQQVRHRTVAVSGSAESASWQRSGVARMLVLLLDFGNAAKNRVEPVLVTETAHRYMYRFSSNVKR